MGEILKFIPFTELKQKRKEFAPGPRGKEAFRLVIQEAPCSVPKVCSNPAKLTVDFDVFGNLEQRPACGEEHAKDIREGVLGDLTRIGQLPSFSSNGFGRSPERNLYSMAKRQASK